jgi:hypothetical protein
MVIPAIASIDPNCAHATGRDEALDPPSLVPTPRLQPASTEAATAAASVELLKMFFVIGGLLIDIRQRPTKVARKSSANGLEQQHGFPRRLRSGVVVKQEAPSR